MTYQVIDNFLPSAEFDALQTMLTLEFPWYYSDAVVYGSDLKEKPHDFQMVHMFYKDYGFNSHYANLVVPIVKKLDPYSLLKIKAKLIGSTNSKIFHGYHTDITNPSPDTKTAVFYVNTNNGQTILKLADGEVCVDSVANRLVMFDANTSHTGTTCTDKKVRCLINLNYLTKTDG
jgi:hypothetical protein